MPSFPGGADVMELDAGVPAPPGGSSFQESEVGYGSRASYVGPRLSGRRRSTIA